MRILALMAVFAVAIAAASHAAEPRRADVLLARYFEARTLKLAEAERNLVRTPEDWISRRGEYRRQLAEMLGLWPEPPRTPLQAQVTGKTDHPEFTVENVQFQSRPGLYVTGNLYVPKGVAQPVPAILYVCGHGTVKQNGVSYGAKAFYQHHGAWLAQNGYVCLTIDTLQLGEIEGLHHGTYREGMWWWPSRGYTPAGVEAWNGIRALDYLQSRPEVDSQRLGITGRSGGGAYSWWVAALDERIKAAVPVAGITDLENHVIDGTVEGHCDCMFTVNTYGWDFSRIAALVAPRPLLIANTDKDGIFPLEGVARTHAGARKIYRLLKAEDKIGLLITEGGHMDTQDLQVPTLHWFNRHLKGADAPVETIAQKLFQPEQLRVFKTLPADQQNTRIHEVFVPAAPAPAVPATADEWKSRREKLLTELRQKSFGGWPAETPEPDMREAFSVKRDGLHLRAFDFESEEHVPLRLWVVQRAGLSKPDLAVLNVLDDKGWKEFLTMLRPGFEDEIARDPLGGPGDAPLKVCPRPDGKAYDQTRQMLRKSPWVMAYVVPRGIGPYVWNSEAKFQTQLRRRFMLLGQTLDGQRVWDVRRALQTLRAVKGLQGTPAWLQAERDMAGIALYASLFEPVARLDLYGLPPTSQAAGPWFLNNLKLLDTPEALALAAERSKVRLYETQASAWEYPLAVARQLKWDAKQIEVR